MNRTQPMARGTVPIRPAATPPAPTPTPTQAVGAGMAMNPAETADYRDLLNKQLMTESSKANASKYLSQAMQSSGVGQTGLAQSVLSGIEMGYQNLAAKNVADYNLLQQEKQFESEQAALDAQALQQQQNAAAGFEFLQTAADLDSLKRYYDAYAAGLTEDQKKAFDLVYAERQKELGFVEAPSNSENRLASQSFGLPEGATAVYTERNEFASFVGNLVDSSQELSSQAAKNAAAALNEAFKASASWGNTRNGTVYQISMEDGNRYYGFYNGRWYEIRGGTAPTTVTRTFKIK